MQDAYGPDDYQNLTNRSLPPTQKKCHKNLLSLLKDISHTVAQKTTKKHDFLGLGKA